jgi:hypothetical protein
MLHQLPISEPARKRKLSMLYSLDQIKPWRWLYVYACFNFTMKNGMVLAKALREQFTRDKKVIYGVGSIPSYGCLCVPHRRKLILLFKIGKV